MNTGQHAGNNPRARLGSGDLFRLENLSDAVFGFALTLLVVSLEVPRTFDDLLASMRGFLAFGLAFTMLILIWSLHGRFFRRYELRDGATIVLNAALLFVVLFYVYPLKFMATVIANLALWLGGLQSAGEELREMLALRDLPETFILYGLGWIAVFLAFALLYWRAYTQREALGLDRVQAFEARAEIGEHLIAVGIGVLSIALAAFEVGVRFGLPGWIYALMGPLTYLHARRTERRRAELEPDAIAPP